MLDSQPASVPLKYTIASSTPHSGKYAPENILEDRPTEQASRWSGAFQGNASQWVTLKVESLSVLKTITFGKYSKPHPCNMKELKVYAGTSEEHMSEILHAGLKNDTTPETFILNHINKAGVIFPTQFVKIVPLMAHGQNFHISIWHVGLAGIAEPEYVEKVRLAYEEYRETAVMRYIVKHLRQRRLLTPSQTILSRSKVYLEHPLITKLHESIVLQGDWIRSEQLLEEISAAGLFDSYLHSRQPYAEWTHLSGTDADGDVPPARGGHAMCIDPINEMIYVFGGYNGAMSLDDFWVYSICDDKWRMLCHSTTDEQNAPGARSCHKMVFDTKTGCIYVLGRLNDSDELREPTPIAVRNRTTPGPFSPSPRRQQEGATPATVASEGTAETKTYCSEFYRYHTRGLLAGKWDFLSIDTAASGGPPLVFDHQMVMDSEAQILYVFGGRVVDGDWDTSKYSGLYSYNISTSKWKLLQVPSALGVDGTNGSVTIPPRCGHSMVIDHMTKILYIFAGQREDKYLSDMYAYDTKTGIATEIFSNFTISGGPEASFTQRAVIDPALKEIYIFCGLTRFSHSIPCGMPESVVSSQAQAMLRDSLLDWVYRYDSRPGKWMRSLRIPDQPARQRPRPRFAHQVVYNPRTRTVFLHGGNAGESKDKSIRTVDDTAGGQREDEQLTDAKDDDLQERLDDFWKMNLKRPGPEGVIRMSRFAIRKQQFRELCEEANPVAALNFLQKEVANVVDHQNLQEEEQFRGLLSYLLSPLSRLDPQHPLKPTLSHMSSSLESHSTSRSSSLEHEDTREGSSRPRKRSRSERDTEARSSTTSSGEESGIWTNEFPVEELHANGVDSDSGIRFLCDTNDPLETGFRGEHADSLSGPRYNQRTEVFESLLKFVNDSEKQPDLSLLVFAENDKIPRSPGLCY